MSRRPGRNGATAPTRSGEPFAHSFEQWLHQLDQDLRSAAEAQYEQDTRDGALLRPLVDRVVSHYESYYRSKSASAKLNVLPMFSPTWTSSTENLFLWAGGWRPSVAFHLLNSKSGLQLDSQLDKLIAGLPTRDLSNLSPDQLARIDRLQRKTIRLEEEISEEEAAVQETVANARMVELTEAITKEGGRSGENGAGDGEEGGGYGDGSREGRSIEAGNFKRGDRDSAADAGGALSVSGGGAAVEGP